MDKFTVVIPTRNRPQIAHELVNYLRLELGWQIPILVVDQSDDQGESLRDRLRGMEKVEHIADTGRGASHARNLGAMRARTPWLIFVDDDVRPCLDYHDILRTFLEKNNWVDTVRASVWKLADWDQYRSDPKAWQVRVRGRNTVRKPRASRRAWPGMDSFLRVPAASYETLTIAINSSSFAIARRAFMGAGGFDEQMGFGEDLEFGFRLWWYGYRTCASPDLFVFHLKHATGGGRDQRNRRESDWIYFWLKWFPGHPLRAFLFGRCLEWARNPMTAPRNLWNLRESYKIARRRFQEGPRYVSAPVPRGMVIDEVELSGPISMGDA